MNDKTLFGRGLGVALATPFTPEGDIDTPALIRLTQHVARGGADFVVALGSTGEAATLGEQERDHVVATVRDAASTMRVFVGTGASSTAQTIACTQRAVALGADAALVVVPPYTRPTPAGIEAHFTAIAEAAPALPLIVYNVPSRTGTNLQSVALRSLWAIDTVVAVKESSGDLLQITRIACELPRGRTLLAGDDALLLPTVAVGGRGVISVAGNVVPRAMRALLDASLAGALPLAQRLQAQLMPLFDALGAEPNPIPIKTALALQGIAGPDLRLPLTLASALTRDRLQRALSDLEEATRPDATHHA